jgi:hypothetical protein
MAVAKHINYFELEKAIDKEPQGCPLCSIIRDRTASWLDDMLFEHISDREFRAKYRAAGGFCPEHAKALESFRDGLAVAIISQGVLEDRIDAMKSGRPYRTHGQCPVCEEKGRIETEYLTFLLECEGNVEDDKQLIQKFESGAGLCAPHYQKLIEIAGRGLFGLHKIPRWLRKFQENKFQTLLDRTGKFIELSAYGRQDEFRKLPPEDQVVWKEIAVNLRGEC